MRKQATLLMSNDKRERVDAIPIEGTPLLLHRNADDGGIGGYRVTLKGTGLNIPYLWGDAVACYYDIQEWFASLPKSVRGLYESRRPNVRRIQNETPKDGLVQLKTHAEDSQ